ncbi:MAG: Heavy-metal resistance [Holophagaceae bacterium]|nr:Heavy-metal resistance [Holophagaceae bacterium]
MSLRSMILGCATLGLLATAPLAAQPFPGCGAPGEGRMGRQMAVTLKLTDEQRSKIEAIRAKHAVELNTKRQAVKDAQKAFHQACLNPASTPAQLKQLHQPVAERQLDLMLAQRAMRLEQRAIMTPEQQAEADKLCQDMGQIGAGMGSHRGGRGMRR